MNTDTGKVYVREEEIRAAKEFGEALKPFSVLIYIPNRPAVDMVPIDDAARLFDQHAEVIHDEVESLKAAVLRTAPEANAEIDRLKKLLDRDQTGLAAALNRCRQVGKGYFWIALGEWGSYDYTEQTQKTLREEIGRCLEEIENTAVLALRESGVRAAAAFQPERDRLAVVEGLLAAYEREAPLLRARAEDAEAALADLRSKHGADAQNEREMWGDAGRPRG